MKRHYVLIIILVLLGLFLAFSAAAHPYDGSRESIQQGPRYSIDSNQRMGEGLLELG